MCLTNRSVIIIVAIFVQFQFTQQTCNSLIYCKGPLLDTVQKLRIFDDSKTFVDMSLRYSPDSVFEKFKTLMNNTNSTPTKQDVEHFISDNFVLNKEIDAWDLPDFKPNPSFLNGINDERIKNFTKNLVKLWPTLARKVNSTVEENPEKHSLIAVPNGFIIPGGRFRELYYWDTYWIIKGLLLSEIKTTVRGMLENFLYLVSKYGFVPNGSRIYYLNRSQPPLLTLMVGLYIEYTNDTGWLGSHVGTLEKELQWWLANRTVVVTKNGKNYTLAHYSADDDTPRPESYFEDVKTCSIYKGSKQKSCYKNIKSAAETGWDFSSRWIFDDNGRTHANISFIQGGRVIPVDLNSFLCKAFHLLSEFFKLDGNKEKASEWSQVSKKWTAAIQAVLYNKNDGIWYDFDTVLSKPRKYFYPSNFAPLWTGMEHFSSSARKYYGAKAAKYFLSKNITDNYLGGIPTSLDNSGQQWDLPNAWPPLQEIVILGLYKTGDKVAQKIAIKYAKRWIESNVNGYNEHQVMFEKYSAVTPGEFGGGGEYTVQSGFGWTNGVGMSLINEFYVKSSKNKVKCLL